MAVLLRYAAVLVPKQKHGETPVYIMATAGLRLLSTRWAIKCYVTREQTTLSSWKKFWSLCWLVEVGRVPGDYPVPALYCTTWHYRDHAGYYFKIWPDLDPGNLSRFLWFSTIPHAVKCKVGIYFVSRPSLMHDTVVSHLTDNCPLGPSRGRADGNLTRDGLINHLTSRAAR